MYKTRNFENADSNLKNRKKDLPCFNEYTESKPHSLVHGGDWAGFQDEFGYEPLDFSINVSPLGLASGVKEAIIQSLDGVCRYPDPLCRRLCRAIGSFEKMDETSVMCGNGAADLIFRLVVAIRPQKALITAPTFAEYKAALDVFDCDCKEFLLLEENGFALGEDFLDHIKDDIDIVFLCEPNNPTGIASDRNLIVKILEKCQEMNCLLVVDECFVDFLDHPSLQTMKAYLTEYNNLLILKSFTKLYSMAGVRLGYCLCKNGELLAKMRKSGQEWTVSYLAENAGLAALKEDCYVENVRALIKEERVRLKKELAELGINRVYGEADYLLFHSDENLANKLRQNGILLRKCDNYTGLGPGWFRLGVKSREDNDRLLKAIQEVL